MGVVFGFHPRELAPVHALRLIAVAVQDASFPAQPIVKIVSRPGRTDEVGLSLASVG